MEKKNIFYTVVISLLGILVIVGFVFNSYQNKQEETTHDKLTKMNVPGKESFSGEVSHEDVKKYEDLTKEKLNKFKRNDLKEGSINNKDNEGIATLSNILSTSGQKIFNPDKDRKEMIKYYDTFDYKISNFSAKQDANNVVVMFNIEVKQSGNKVHPSQDLYTLEFDENDNLVGGEVYARA